MCWCRVTIFRSSQFGFSRSYSFSEWLAGIITLCGKKPKVGRSLIIIVQLDLFFKPLCQFPNICSYRASLFLKCSKWVMHMQPQSCPGQCKGGRPFLSTPWIEYSEQKPMPTVCPGAAQALWVRSRRQFLWPDSFSLFEGVGQPRVFLYPWTRRTKGLSNHSHVSCFSSFIQY